MPLALFSCIEIIRQRRERNFDNRHVDPGRDR